MNETVNEQRAAAEVQTKVLVLDDSHRFHELAQNYFATAENFELLATVFTSQEAVVKCGHWMPEMVIVDLGILLNEMLNPISRSENVIKQLKTLPHPPKVVVLTHHNSEEYRSAVLKLGADMFIWEAQFPAMLPLLRNRFGLTQNATTTVEP